VEDGGRKSHLTPSDLLSWEWRMVGGRVILLPPTSSPGSGGCKIEFCSLLLDSLSPTVVSQNGWSGKM